MCNQIFPHSSNHFVTYEQDNIPDHRSRRFGCCPCVMAVLPQKRACDTNKRKAALNAGTFNTASAKRPTSKSTILHHYLTIK